MPGWQPQRRPRHQGPINSFFLAFKPAVCQPSKPTKRSKCLFGRPNPAGQGTKAQSIAFSWRSSLPFASLQNPPNAPKLHQYLFLDVQACHLPALKTHQTLQLPLWAPQPRRPRHQGAITSFFLAFKLAAKRSKCLFGPQPRRPRHQGPITSFFLAFKPAVCAVCQPSKPTKHSKCLFGRPNPAGQGTNAPAPQARAARPHQ